MPRKRNQQPRSRDTSGTGDHSLLRKGDQMPATVSDLPTMERPSMPTKQPEPVKESHPDVKRPDVVVGSITITVPFVWGSPGYVSRRLQVPRMTARQSSALRAVQSGFGENGDALKNGRPVANNSHAMQKLLDDIADAIEKASA